MGLEPRSLDGPHAIGVDEIVRRKRQVYSTMVLQNGARCRRLLWIGRDRAAASLHKSFDPTGERAKTIASVASDTWRPYLGVFDERAPGSCTWTSIAPAS